MKAKQLTVLILMLGTTTSIALGQSTAAQSTDTSRVPTLDLCKDDPPRKTVISAVLPSPIDTKKSKLGDHIAIKVFSPCPQSIAKLDAVITDVQPAESGSRSALRIRIDEALNKDGHELPSQIKIVAIASQSVVTEEWTSPYIIADRFPRTPEDDERLPGETKTSEDQRHTSPLDTMPDVPTQRTSVCDKRAAKGPANHCVKLLEARGIYGYKDVMFEPGSANSNDDVVLTSTRNIRLPAGTYIVLEADKTQGPKN